MASLVAREPHGGLLVLPEPFTNAHRDQIIAQSAVIADRGALGPMSQQRADDPYGHEMHPQKLVQLVGCHHPHAGKHEVTDRLIAQL